MHFGFTAFAGNKFYIFYELFCLYKWFYVTCLKYYKIRQVSFLANILKQMYIIFVIVSIIETYEIMSLWSETGGFNFEWIIYKCIIYNK